MIEFTEAEKDLIIYALMFSSENLSGFSKAEYKMAATIIKKLKGENK